MRDAPSNGFLLERDLLTSGDTQSVILERIQLHQLTLNTGLNGILDGRLEDLALSPDFNHPFQLLLDLVRRSTVSNRGRLCDNLQ